MELTLYGCPVYERDQGQNKASQYMLTPVLKTPCPQQLVKIAQMYLQNQPKANASENPWRAITRSDSNRNTNVSVVVTENTHSFPINLSRMSSL